MGRVYHIKVDHIDFDLESDDLREITMDTPEEDYRLALDQEWALGKIYAITAHDQDDAVMMVVDEITDGSGWLIRNVDYDFVDQ